MSNYKNLENKKGNKMTDYIGRKFGRLTVLKLDSIAKTIKKYTCVNAIVEH
jgi:hypothetical protein